MERNRKYSSTTRETANPNRAYFIGPSIKTRRKDIIADDIATPIAIALTNVELFVNTDLLNIERSLLFGVLQAAR